ncbi:hypothetical protein HDA44_002608 [Kribbella solani]|uniref:Uncharacterized protein n=1 Tax=Kribbella solani TaxID=236067 RepID=A0A841DSG2_9ACTN|nr:hypothetical protein [Kribbella solani]
MRMAGGGGWMGWGVVGGEVGWEWGRVPRWWVRVVRASRSDCGVLGWRVASVRTGRPEASKRMFCWVMEPWVRPMEWR